MFRARSILAFLVVALLLPACRTVASNAPPEVPPGTTMLILADDEMPRVLYASAWGAFAEAGWDVVDHDSEAMRFVARPEEGAGEAEVSIQTDTERATARAGRIVVRVDPAHPEAREVLLGAARALATVPGHFSFR